MNDFINYKGYLSTLSVKDLKQLYKMLEEYKIKYRSNLGIFDNISFGVEIEFENTYLDSLKKEIGNNFIYKYWCVHKDDSVSSYVDERILGGEISTDILHDFKEDWVNLQNVFKILNRLDATVTDKTAFHIHVGAQIFKTDIKYTIRFIKLWCVFEDIIYRFGYGNTSVKRKNIDMFAPPIAPLYRKIFLHNNKYFNEIECTKEFDFGKKRAVNFKNYHYLEDEEEINNTIEIRTPNGTLDYVIAQNNINFFIKLMLYVTSDNYDEKLIDKMFQNLPFKTLNDYSNFDVKKAIFLSDLIFNNSLDKINFLRQYIKEDDYIYLR